MSDTVTPDAPAEAVADEVRLSKLEFAKRFNRAVSGKATFDAISDGSKLTPPVKVTVDQPVPVSRKHIAAYCGLSYNALIAREKSARTSGINLATLERGKRGKSANVDEINAALATDAVVGEIANG